MPTEWLAVSSLTAFLAVFTRVGSALVLIPLPGMRGAITPIRVVLALALTVILMPAWPRDLALPGDVGGIVALLLGETVIGLLLGLVASVSVECLVLSAQVVSLQAGYSYASTIDPASEADAGVLTVVAQLAASLIFLGCGLDRPLFGALARSLAAWPPGSSLAPAAFVPEAVRLGAIVLEYGMRLAIPVVALLLLTDVTLALLARINAQLPLLSVSFSIKMLAALFLLAWLAPGWPAILKSAAEAAWRPMATQVAGKAGG